jgi:hypothetical protein
MCVLRYLPTASRDFSVLRKFLAAPGRIPAAPGLLSAAPQQLQAAPRLKKTCLLHFPLTPAASAYLLPHLLVQLFE